MPTLPDLATNDNFLKALEEAGHVSIDPADIEYRIYYDGVTKECTMKTTEKPPGYYIVVSRDEYEKVYFCPHYFINEYGQVEKKKEDFTPKVSVRKDIDGKFKTVKDDVVFRIDDAFTGSTDSWTILGNNIDDEY